jgi:PIN domain nuclease of toxin-antitoxin system
MIYLLDTQTFIWTILQTTKLSRYSKEIIANRSNEICVSAVSFWEISLKTKTNKFSFVNINIDDFPKYAKNMGFTIIDMQEKETMTFHRLPMKKNHKDPFERMLIWQAITRDMTMISKDEAFEQYKKDGLKIIW